MGEIPAIGDVVREWRQDRQISLTEFSRRTGLSKGYISELEHNKIDNPKSDKRKRIAAALGITERDMLSRRMPDEMRAVVSQQTQKASPLSTVFHAPLSISDQEIVKHRLAVLKKRLEAAEKNLYDAHEELRELYALVAEMFSQE
ncbi:MAG: helix-turn-helix domain-containing protein [Nitrososphaera sp.]